jgi:hypothetical protein
MSERVPDAERQAAIDCIRLEFSEALRPPGNCCQEAAAEKGGVSAGAAWLGMNRSQP